MSNVGKKVKLSEDYWQIKKPENSDVNVWEIESGGADCNAFIVRHIINRHVTAVPYSPTSPIPQCTIIDYSLSAIRGKKYAVWCKTQAEWDKVRIFDKGRVKLSESMYEKYGANSCIAICHDEDMSFSPKEYYTEGGCTIITAAEFLHFNTPATDPVQTEIEQLEKRLKELKEKKVFKVCDWVYVFDSTKTSENINGDVRQIDKIEDGYLTGKMQTIYRLGESARWEPASAIRPATPAEIAAAQTRTITIQGFPWLIAKDKITFAAITFTIADMQTIIETYNEVN